MPATIRSTTITKAAKPSPPAARRPRLRRARADATDGGGRVRPGAGGHQLPSTPRSHPSTGVTEGTSLVEGPSCSLIAHLPPARTVPRPSDEGFDVLRRPPQGGPTIVGDQDGPFDEDRMLDHDRDPPSAVVGQVGEVELLGDVLAHAGDLPRLHVERGEDPVE